MKINIYMKIILNVSSALIPFVSVKIRISFYFIDHYSKIIY